MKRAKKIGLLLIFFITIAMLFCNSNFAQSTTSGKYLGLYNRGNGRPTGYYTSGRKNGSSSAILPIIKIVEYANSSGSSPKDPNEAIYCIKDGIGFGLNNTTGSTSQVGVVYYNNYFDFKDRASITGSYAGSNVFPQNSNYNKLLWLLDNICIPEDADSVKNLLDKVGLTKEDFTEGMDNGQEEKEFKDLIEVIQQAAIWYITNAGDTYQPQSRDTFNVATSKGGTYSEDICDKYDYYEVDCPIDTLYEYLITEPNNHTNYTSSSSSQALTFIKSGVSTQIDNGNYIIGPYKIQENGQNYSNFSASVNANGVSQSDIKILDSSRRNISGNSISDKIKSNIGKDFYIQVPVSSIKNETNITVSITATNINRKITYWSVGASSVSSNQPVVVIDDTKDSFNDSDTKKVTPDFVNVSVTKQWNDSNDQEKLRPTKVSVELLADGVHNSTIELNASNNWTHTFTNLQKYNSKGTAINYTVRETSIPNGYTASTTGNATSGYTIINTHNSINLSIPVEKVWSDNNDEAGLRPAEVEVELLADNAVLQTIKLNATNGWKHTFTDLQKNAADGHEINYTVNEKTTINGYTSTVSGNKTDGFTITNYHKTDKTQVTVKKVWNDADNAQGSRPTSIVVELLANGTFTKEVTLNESNNWQYTFTDLDTEKDGAEVNYTVREKNIPEGYTTQITGDARNGYVIKNTYGRFDLALRKYITKINDTQLKDLNIPSRDPHIIDTDLENKQDTTADYNHKKDPILVKDNDKVTYNITVYNEGEKTGYASQIIDQLPSGLVLLTSGTVTSIGSDGQAKNTYRVQYNESTNRVTFDIQGQPKDLKSFNGDLDFETIELDCKVDYKAVSSKNGILTNTAWISNDYDTEDNTSGDDIDSQPSNSPNVNKDNMENYKGKDTNPSDLSDSNHFYEGEQDDDDFEKIILEKFDLALRKFITGVNDEEITTRVPTVDTSKYGTIVDGKEVTDMEYNHTKEPVRVANNDVVVYTIRVYNEGTQSGYAAEIKDDIPEGLEFIQEHEINERYKWIMYDKDGNITTDIKQAVTVVTDYLSKANEETEGENFLKGFDPTTMNTPDYRDVEIAFRVTEPNTSDRTITNQAQISKDTDEEGEEVEDADSTPNEWNQGEDDQDVEHLYVKYFDLSLRKWVSQAILIEDGIQKEMDTNHYAEQDPEPVVKVELNKDRIENTIVKFRYQIRVTNEGEIEGYATEISDYIPDGLKFNQADNPKWTEENGKIVTDQLKDTLLQPGESATIEVLLTWINGDDNLNLKLNVAEISEDSNSSNSPDIDSTPNNKKEGEDDIDDAPVILTVVTGIIQNYIAIIAGATLIICAGVFTIKKYVV